MADGYFTVVVDFPGQEQLIRGIATFGQDITHLQPAWEEVGNYLLQDFAAQFHNEGGFLGAQVGPLWAQLRPATVADRMRKGYPGEHPILQRSGSLMESVTQRNAAGNVFEASNEGLRIGTTHELAKYHQYGTKKMVARKMIGLRFQTRSEIVRIFGDYIRGLIRAAGLS
jgi:phage gpG-like protein